MEFVVSYIARFSNRSRSLKLPGGDWEELGILGGRALRDIRPLTVRGQPEVREYQARFFDGTTEISGDWSPVEGVTVSP